MDSAIAALIWATIHKQEAKMPEFYIKPAPIVVEYNKPAANSTLAFNSRITKPTGTFKTFQPDQTGLEPAPTYIDQAAAELQAMQEQYNCPSYTACMNVIHGTPEGWQQGSEVTPVQ